MEMDAFFDVDVNGDVDGGAIAVGGKFG